MRGIIPAIQMQFLDQNGNPLSGGTVETYLAGSSTPTDTWPDATGLAPNTNPVLLDAAGKASIWLDGETAYKFIVRDSNGAQIDSIDNVRAVGTGGGSGSIAAGDGISIQIVNDTAIITNTGVLKDRANVVDPEFEIDLETGPKLKVDQGLMRFSAPAGGPPAVSASSAWIQPANGEVQGGPLLHVVLPDDLVGQGAPLVQVEGDYNGMMMDLRHTRDVESLGWPAVSVGTRLTGNQGNTPVVSVVNAGNAENLTLAEFAGHSSAANDGGLVRALVTSGEGPAIVTNGEIREYYTPLEKRYASVDSDSTSWVSGGGLVKTGNTFTVMPLDFHIVNLDGFQKRSLTVPITNIPVDNINTPGVSFVFIDANYQITQKMGDITPEERRNKLVLGALYHFTAGTLDAVKFSPTCANNVYSALNDVMSEFVALKNGIFVTGNANGTIANGAGYLLALNINLENNQMNPNQQVIPASNPVSMIRFTRNAIVAAAQTVLDTTNYDLNGVLTPLPANNWQNIRIFVAKDGRWAYQNGQTAYANKNDALLGINRNPFILNPTLNKNVMLAAIVTVKRAAVNLTDDTLCQISVTDLFGLAGSSAASGSTAATLQDVFNNGQTIDTTGKSPLTIKTTTGNSVEIQNGSGTLGVALRNDGAVINANARGVKAYPSNRMEYGQITNDSDSGADHHFRGNMFITTGSQEGFGVGYPTAVAGQKTGLCMKMYDSGGQWKDYGCIYSYIIDNTAASWDGGLKFAVYKDGVEQLVTLDNGRLLSNVSQVTATSIASGGNASFNMKLFDGTDIGWMGKGSSETHIYLVSDLGDVVFRNSSVTRARFAGTAFRPETANGCALGSTTYPFSEAWIGAMGTITLQTGFTQADSTRSAAAYLMPNGFVALRGGAASASDIANGTTLAQLPVGYRPPSTRYIPAAAWSSSGTIIGCCVLEINNYGYITLKGYSGEPVSRVTFEGAQFSI